MTYYCNLCDKINNPNSKHKHLRSKKHKHLEGFIIMRYIVENPDSTQLNQILKKFFRILKTILKGIGYIKIIVC